MTLATEPGGRPTRRRLLALVAAGAAGLAAVRLAIPWWLRAGPVRRTDELSPEARRVVAEALAGLDLARVWDAHVHLAGLGTGGAGTWVHPDMRSHLHPWRRLQYDVYLAASGVRDRDRADAEYVERLVALQRAANPAGRALVLAFDLRVGQDGEEDRARSPFLVPTERALALAARHPELEACASVHPYRRDALARLDAAAEGGARAIKWLPNAMGIDPLSPRCDPFYRRLAELGLPLLSHTGVEHAVAATEDQELGNPLRLRRALDRGVRVIAAHCASLGEARDLDAGGGSAPAFDLFLRMAGEDHGGRLHGGLSATTLVNRSPRVLRELLAASELHPRLVYGSDYPLPAIDPLVSARRLARQGVLADADVGPLEEVQEANPLLLPLVLLRRLRLEGPDGPRRLPAACFETAGLLAPAGR